MPHALSSRTRATLGFLLTLGLVSGTLGGAAASADPIAVTVSGSISPQWGGALHGATVELFAANAATPIDTVVADDGSFSFPVTEPGDYKVRASAEGFDSRWWGDAADFAGGMIIPVLDADVPGIDITMPVSVYTLTGTVTGGSPAVPLEGVGVEVHGEFGGWTDQVTTNASGQYEVSGLPERGTVHFTGVGEFASEWFADVPDENSATLLTFDADRTADAELAQAGSIAGTVRGPLVLGGPAEPLGSATATLYTTAGAMVTQVYADDEGAYRLEGIAAGAYRLSFTGPESSADWKNGFLGGVDRLSLSPIVTLGSDQELTGVDASLVRIPVLSGTVFNGATGEPIDTAHLTLRSLNGTVLDDAWTDDGRYAFRDVPTGSYLIHVWQSGFEAGAWYGGLSHTSATPIVVTRGVSVTGKDITLAPAGFITGTVLADGIASLNAQMKLFTRSGQELQSVFISSDGAYTFYGVKPGDYLVRFVPAPGRLVGEWWDNARSRVTAKSVHVVAGETTTLGDIVPTTLDTGRITGRFVGGAGTEVVVSGPGMQWGVPRSIPISESGNYVVEGLAPGTFRLDFVDGQSIGAVVAPSKTTVAKVVTRRALVTVDAMAESSGEGIGASVEFYTLTGALVASTLTNWDSAGQVTLPRGRYKVRFSVTEYELGKGVVWLGGKADFRTSGILDLRTVDSASVTGNLPAASSFSARVVEAAKGRALDSVSVVVWERQPNGTYLALSTRSGVTNTAGRFTVAALGAGVYKFQLIDEQYRTYRTSWYGGVSLSTAAAVTVSLTPKALSGSLVTRLLPVTGTVGVKAPTISGTMKVGRKLTARTAFVWPATGVVKTYRWYRNGVAITGAGKSTYVLKKVDAGKEITVRVTGSRSGYVGAGTMSLPRNTLD